MLLFHLVMEATSCEGSGVLYDSHSPLALLLLPHRLVDTSSRPFRTTRPGLSRTYACDRLFKIWGLLCNRLARMVPQRRGSDELGIIMTFPIDIKMFNFGIHTSEIYETQVGNDVQCICTRFVCGTRLHLLSCGPHGNARVSCV
jgi:hypothetical protein